MLFFVVIQLHGCMWLFWTFPLNSWCVTSYIVHVCIVPGELVLSPERLQSAVLLLSSSVHKMIYVCTSKFMVQTRHYFMLCATLLLKYKQELSLLCSSFYLGHSNYYLLSDWNLNWNPWEQFAVIWPDLRYVTSKKKVSWKVRPVSCSRDMPWQNWLILTSRLCLRHFFSRSLKQWPRTGDGKFVRF
jgi:hypothetical protein